MVETASTWDSFKDTLIKVLAEFKPKTVMEWGPGVSTLIMQDFPSVEHIDTVEHDEAWHGKWQGKFGNKVTLTFEKNLANYPYAGRKLQDYDLYFVDGREREQCLKISCAMNGIVILHDAERESYQPYIKMFNYIFMEDDGHTAVMTNNKECTDRLEKIFDYERK